MAFADTNGLRTYYRLDGSPDLPVLVLSHSLGLDHGMWDPQMADLTAHFRVLRYDTRGHGATEAPAGDYSMAQLGRDALALVDALGIGQAAWCGVSLGGMIGQWIAVHAPERLTALVLANTSPKVADPSAMEARRTTVLANGMPAVVDAVMSRFFAAPLLEATPPRVASARTTVLATSAVGYAGCCAALRDFDGTADLGRIRTRTLVVGGDGDVSMPWNEHGFVLASDIAGAHHVRMATAHLSNLGLPRTFTRIVLEFLAPRGDDPLEAGLEVRRAMLGADHVARSMAAATELTRGFQHLITSTVWGGLWTRPGLDRPTRRLLVLMATAALGRWEEFELHLVAGLGRELEWSTVEEVLLTAAMYAGVPSANTAFRIASDVARRTGATGPADSSH